MPKIPLLLITVLSFQLSFAQLVPSPRFSFERLSFGQTLQEVKKTLKGKVLLNYPTSLFPSGSRRPQDTTFIYEDTCFSAWVGVGLVFSKETKRLNAVAVMYTGVDPNSGETVPNLQREVERLWTAFRKRYGSGAAQEQNSPFGLELSWDHEKATVKMLRTDSPGHALFLKYEPPQP